MNRSGPPPRFVPTLTEIVQAPASTGAAAPEALVQPVAAAADSELFQEQLVHRVMQRVDLSLERLLRETVGRLVMEHTQALAPSLRDEIEILVRHSVNQALAQELSAQPSDRR